MAVIFRGLSSKLPVTIRTVGLGSEWSWGTYGNRRHSGCVLQRDTGVPLLSATEAGSRFRLCRSGDNRAQKSPLVSADLPCTTPMRLTPIVHGSHECASRRHWSATSNPTRSVTRNPRRSARTKSKEFAVNLRRPASQRGTALHHPVHRGMLPVLVLHPMLRPA